MALREMSAFCHKLWQKYPGATTSRLSRRSKNWKNGSGTSSKRLSTAGLAPSSSYQLLPKHVRNALPSPEQLETELERVDKKPTT